MKLGKLKEGDFLSQSLNKDECVIIEVELLCLKSRLKCVHCLPEKLSLVYLTDKLFSTCWMS